MKHHIFAAALAVISLAFAISCARPTYQNPVLESGPDPWVFQQGDTYYYMHTTGRNLQLRRTKDMTDIKNAEIRKIWSPDKPDTCYSRDVWAPEVHCIDGKWYVLFAADGGNTDDHQMFVLENTSADPFEGEFVMKGRISTDPDNNWAIDGSYFHHNGQLYMIWSGWQTRRVDVETQCIYIARMKNPWTLDSERVLLSKPEYDWERLNIKPDGTQMDHVIYVNEGPQALKDPSGKYIHVIYSASGCWTPYYCLGQLTADVDADLLDPASWRKSDHAVFGMRSEDDICSTGHNGFFMSPDGKEDYIIYHARMGKDDPKRATYIQKFTWKDGYPQFGIPEPQSALLKKPSGTKE